MVVGPLPLCSPPSQPLTCFPWLFCIIWSPAPFTCISLPPINPPHELQLTLPMPRFPPSHANSTPSPLAMSRPESHLLPPQVRAMELLQKDLRAVLDGRCDAQQKCGAVSALVWMQLDARTPLVTPAALYSHVSTGGVTFLRAGALEPWPPHLVSSLLKCLVARSVASNSMVGDLNVPLHIPPPPSSPAYPSAALPMPSLPHVGEGRESFPFPSPSMPLRADISTSPPFHPPSRFLFPSFPCSLSMFALSRLPCLRYSSFGLCCFSASASLLSPPMDMLHRNPDEH